MNDDLPYSFDSSGVINKPDTSKDPDYAHVSILRETVKDLDNYIKTFNTFDVIDGRRKLSVAQQVEMYKELVKILRNVREPIQNKVERIEDERR